MQRPDWPTSKRPRATTSSSTALIARATHNELFLLLMDSIGSSLIDIRRENLRPGPAPTTLGQHERLLELIAAHDPEAARTAMAAHLEGVAEFWREREIEAGTAG